MPQAVHRVLIAGLPGSEAAPFATELESLEYEVEVVERPEEAVDRIREKSYGAVVCAYPLAAGAVGTLVLAMRGGDSVNRGTGLVLLTAPDRVRAAGGMVGRGVNKVLSLAEEPMVLGVVVEQLVERFQPMSERLPMRTPVEVEHNGEQLRLRTENVSGLGMLVGATAPPPLGRRVRFRLHLQGGAVEGEAKVVRHTQEPRESAAGFGARFVSFEGDGRERLLAFLRAARGVTGRGTASA